MGGIGGPELLLVFLVILLVFGPKKIPEVARGIGKGVREFRRLTTEFQREMNLSDALEEEKKRPTIDRPGAGGTPAATSAETAPKEDRPLPPGAETPGTETGRIPRERGSGPPASD